MANDYLKLCSTHADYLTFKASANYIEPNVSYCENENEVHYNPYTDPRVIATFNVTSTSNATSIMYSSATSLFDKIWIDGVEQQSVVASYTFNTTGEHAVKYSLVNSTTIGQTAFFMCSNLTSITIPNSVTSIGNAAFAACTSLTDIIMTDTITTIGNGAFSGCSALTSITIPNSVTTISDEAFINCTGLTSIGGVGSCTSVEIPNSVTSISNSVFKGCTGLTSVNIPNSVTSIGESAFYGCTGLESVTIGNSVTSIGNQAFQSCTGLESITSLATTAPTIYNQTFYGVKTNSTLYVPTGSDYSVWMGTGDYYLGKYGWTKVEQ